MAVKSMYIPKSERGRKVVRTLKGAGYPATYKNTIGKYVIALPFFGALMTDTETLRKVAYDIDPEVGRWMDGRVEEEAQSILTDSVYGHNVTEEEAWREAENRIFL